MFITKKFHLAVTAEKDRLLGVERGNRKAMCERMEGQIAYLNKQLDAANAELARFRNGRARSNAALAAANAARSEAARGKGE